MGGVSILLGAIRCGCLVVLLVAGVWTPADAHQTTGEVSAVVISQDGVPLSGVALVLANPDHGLRFTATSDREGRGTFVALPVGSYRLTANLEGFKTVSSAVRVALGQTTAVRLELPIGPVTDTIEVTAAPAVIDTTSTVTGITADTDELARRLPLSRDVTQVALLAPATVPADSRFDNGAIWEYGTTSTRYYTPGQGLTALGGASPAENVYLVNGLNTSNVYQGLGSTFVPMDFVEEIQVKTGGYEAEYGRATGGVINLVTKSGSNTLRGGASLYWEPAGLQSLQPDTFTEAADGSVAVFDHNQDEERELFEANLSLGGPIVRDRLFAFGFLRWVDSEQLEAFGNFGQRSAYAEPSYGAKLDWNLTSRHRLEGTYLSDATVVDMTNLVFDPTDRRLGSVIAAGTRSRGGDNAILRYTGLMTDSFLLSAQVGRNQFDRTDHANRDEECPYAWDTRGGTLRYVGCWIFVWRGSLIDTRTAARIDGDLFVGRHSLRAGLDAEAADSPLDTIEHAGGIYYRYFTNGIGVLLPDVPPGEEIVRVRYFKVDGSTSVDSESAYAQDSWAAAPNLTINAGLRFERYRVTNAAGAPFLEISDQTAPRVGAVWDIAGDGRSRLYGSYGTYHVPVNTALLINNQAGEWTWIRSWFPLEGGILPDGTPEGLGPQIGDTLVLADGNVMNPRWYSDNEIEPMSQDEIIIGFERTVGNNWSVGARAVGRWFNEVIEDIDLSRALWEKYGFEPCSPENFGRDPRCQLLAHLRLTNPGTDFRGWVDVDGDLVPDEVSFTADELGIPGPVRNYRAVELTVSRRFVNRWMLEGSYTWSHLEGNYGGLVNSDFGQDSTNLNIEFDLAGEMEHSRGDLPDDRRHSLKLYGSYLFDLGLSLGGSFWFASGRPINGFGMHPTDPWTQVSALAPMNGPYAFYNGGLPCPRGCGGRTPNTWSLDLTARYDFQAAGAGWHARLDVFNVLDNDDVTKVDEVAEDETFQPNPDYLRPRFFQAPRSVRLGVGVSF
jgi:hypothetical protein